MMPNDLVAPARERAARENADILQLKTYYISKSGLFNANSRIFAEKRRDEILRTLDTRARENPGGASEKTL